MDDTVYEPEEVSSTTTSYFVDYGPSSVVTTTTNGRRHHHHSQDSASGGSAGSGLVDSEHLYTQPVRATGSEEEDRQQLEGSALSLHSEVTASKGTTHLVSKTQTNHITQQISTTTKVIREIQHIGPDGSVLSRAEYPVTGDGGSPHPHMDPYRAHSPNTQGSRTGQPYDGYDPYNGRDGGGGGGPQDDYPPYGYHPPPPGDPGYPGPHHYPDPGGYPPSGYAELDRTLAPPGADPYHTTSPSPGLHSATATLDRYGEPQPAQVRWRDPDLHEVIDFLSNPNNVVKANAAAYLQHLCYMDDPTKQKTRILGGIPPLVALLSHDLPDLHRNACGALRNLSYGRQNDENKRAIKDAGGIPALIRLLKKTRDSEVKELVTGILWNLSSCEELKGPILEEGSAVLVSHVLVPASGWDGGEVERDPNTDVWWSTVFKNASGVLRNVSSAGEHARTRLRQCPGLIDALLAVIKSAIHGSSHDNKCVENCVCILRNLSYRCQEVDDPNYDKNQPVVPTRATAATAKGDNLGCFGGSRNKKREGGPGGAASGVDGVTAPGVGGTRTISGGHRTEPPRGMELLWQPDLVVQPYLSLLSECSNPETLEAAAGAIQNLAACYWQPSVEVRAAVRKEKGLPILVELLRMEVDRVVCAVATALRNLAIDQRNKELIGKYAMRDLVQKLPSSQGGRPEATASDETIAAVLATLNEVIKKSTEFSRALMECDGVERLVHMTRQRGRYSPRVVKFASQVLFSMWAHQELREVYKRAGWKEQDFVSKSVSARAAGNGGVVESSNSLVGVGGGGGGHSPTANNTLSRPMASQGGTRYEDRTLHRNNQARHQQYARGEEVPLANMGYGGEDHLAEGVRLYGQQQGQGREPVYAKVNRDKKRPRQYDHELLYGTTGAAPPSPGHLPQHSAPDDWSGPGYASLPPSSSQQQLNNNNTIVNSNTGSNGSVMMMSAADEQQLQHSTAAALLNTATMRSTGSGTYGTTGAGNGSLAGDGGGAAQAGDSWV